MVKKEDQINLEASSSELYIDSGNSENFCTSLVYEPTNITEIQTGNLYISGEVKTASKKCSYLINSLASTIKKELYRNSKRQAADSFEASLSKANSFLGDIASQGNVDWIGKIHIVCTLFSKGELHIAHTGNAKILLLRNARLTSITGDSLKGAETPFPSKTFANITSGPVQNGDRIILSTPGLFNLLSIEEMRHVLSAPSCAKAIENLGEISEMDESAEASSVIVVDVLLPEFSFEKSKLDKNSSLEEYSQFGYEGSFFPEKLSLKDILGESFPAQSRVSRQYLSSVQISKLSSCAKYFKSIKENFIKYSTAFFKKFLNFIFKYSQKIIRLLLISAKNLFYHSVLLTASIMQKIKNRQTEKEIAPVNSEFGKNLEILAGLSCENITENKIIIKIKKQEEFSHNNGIKEKLSSKKNIYLQIERILKFSIPVLTIAAGIFGTFFFREKNAPASSDMPTKINAIVYQGYLQKARQNQQNAETALIYKDEKKAGELLKEAGELIEKSMQMGAPNKDFEQLKKDIQTQIDQIDKITTIQSPFLICDIASLSETFDGSKISVENGAFSIIDIANSKVADIDIAAYKAKNISDISLPSYALGSDYSEYGGNMYVLDKIENQIFKLVAEQKKAWIKQAGIDLSSAVSMSIDGNIYVLNSEGIISKFTSGKLKAFFQIAGLEKPEKIFVQAEGDKLAILDPSAKKIVITAKNGELLSRLKSDSFDDLRDVYIDPAVNGMYVLNGNKIYRVDL